MIDLPYLKSTVNKRIFNKNDPKWIEAFADYNTQNTSKLGMGCTGCYYKVLQFHEEKASKAQVG